MNGSARLRSLNPCPSAIRGEWPIQRIEPSSLPVGEPLAENLVDARGRLVLESRNTLTQAQIERMASRYQDGLYVETSTDFLPQPIGND